MASQISNKVPLRIADLFCGAGGLSEGFRQAGYEVAFALDKDGDSTATFSRNHPNATVVTGSIVDFSPAELIALMGDIDVIVGGPSCQGFSTAGRRTGWVQPSDERNRLWEHMLALVEEARPRAFLMENVPGMVMWKDGQFGDKILKAYRNLGYSVSMQILLAADYGVPQRRRRLFIVGIDDSVPFDFPIATHMGGWRRDTLHIWDERRKELGLYRHLSVWETIGDLPPLGISTGVPAMLYRDARLSAIARQLRTGSKTITAHTTRPIDDIHRELISHVPQGGTWRDIPPHLLPDRYRGMRRTDSTNLLGRLDPNLPAYTINTQFYNLTTGCYTHPYEDRSLTIREGARLQTFPDRYEFTGTINSQCRQIGNAVPPLLARRLAEELAQQILGIALPAKWKRARPVRPAAQLPPPPTNSVTAARMSKQKKTDTRPEALLRVALLGGGLMPEVNVRILPELRRTADLVLRDSRLAIFLDGCFWHGCPGHARPTKSNTIWWAEKIAKNKARDLETTQHLEEAGWTVIRVWEHEAPAAAAERILGLVRSTAPDSAGLLA